MLLFFSLPILLLITLEGPRYRAHANWAAPAFPAVVIWTTALFIEQHKWRSFASLVAINGSVPFLIACTVAVATPDKMPAILKPLRQLFG